MGNWPFNDGGAYDRYNSGGGYNKGGYSNRGYSNRGYNGGQKKKRSGCRSKAVSYDGISYTAVYGWNYSKERGLISVVARPRKGSKEAKSESGRIWIPYTVVITNKRTLQTTFASGLYDKQTNRVYIKELNMIMSPNKNYFGRHLGGKRN